MLPVWHAYGTRRDESVTGVGRTYAATALSRCPKFEHVFSDLNGVERSSLTNIVPYHEQGQSTRIIGILADSSHPDVVLARDLARLRMCTWTDTVHHLDARSPAQYLDRRIAGNLLGKAGPYRLAVSVTHRHAHR